MFLALVGMAETNALKAYRATVGEMTRFKWLLELSEALINNPWLEAEDMEVPAAPLGEPSRGCGDLRYMEHHAKCVRCRGSTHWVCPCGAYLCRAGVTAKKQGPPCYFEHLKEKFGGGPITPEGPPA